MDFINDIDKMKKTLAENAQFMKSFEGSFEDELKKLNDEMNNKRLDMGETLIRLKNKQKRLDQNLQKAVAESNNLDEIEQKIKELNKAEENNRANVKSTTEYKQFKEEILGKKSVSKSDGDCDIPMEIVENGNTACSMYDPWTKKLMTKPMRNIKCGHHYDLDSVTSVITVNLTVRCPFVGCASEIFIQPNHLKADMTLQQKIMNYKEQMCALNSDDEN